MRKIAVSTARDKFTDLVNEVAYTKEPVTLTRRGRPLAVLIPIADAAATSARLPDRHLSVSAALLRPKS